MRSGEHELWDAHVATGRARAQIAALAALAGDMARAMRPVVTALAAGARSLAKLAPLLGLPPSAPRHREASPSRARAPGDPRQETDVQSDRT